MTYGDLSIWWMDGIDILLEDTIGSVGDPDWKIVSTEDFNGDGKLDFLWQHQVRADIYIWFMNGIAWLDSLSLGTVSDKNWKIVGTADFNGDCKPDILWHHAVRGDVYVWFMDGVKFLDGGHVLYNTANAVGGGIRLWGASTLVVSGGSTIDHNESLGGQGGAIAAGGTPDIDIADATLSHNSASGYGGAIYLAAGTLDASRAILHHNSALRGGAIYQEGVAASNIQNSLFYANRIHKRGDEIGQIIDMVRSFKRFFCFPMPDQIDSINAMTFRQRMDIQEPVFHAVGNAVQKENRSPFTNHPIARIHRPNFDITIFWYIHSPRSL